MVGSRFHLFVSHSETTRLSPKLNCMCTSLIELLQINKSTFLSSGRSIAIMLENTYNHRNTYNYTLLQYTWNILICFINPIIKGTHCYLKSRAVVSDLQRPTANYCQVLYCFLRFHPLFTNIMAENRMYQRNAEIRPFYIGLNQQLTEPGQP